MVSWKIDYYFSFTAN